MGRQLSPIQHSHFGATRQNYKGGEKDGTKKCCETNGKKCENGVAFAVLGDSLIPLATKVAVTLGTAAL
jgi:hypothetical protein